MKISPIAFLGFFLPQTTHAVFRPYRLSYKDLVQGTWNREEFAAALADSGIVSLVDMHGVPHETMIEHQHECLVKNAGEVVQAKDGTVRYTVATETVRGELQALPVHPDGCSQFLQVSKEFRNQVKEAVESFSEGLEEMFELKESLVNPTSGSSVTSVSELVSIGRHLEHFHSYVKSPEAPQDEVSTKMNTLDWHIDQGLFLAFTPGRWSHTGKTTEGFFVRTTAGSMEEVEFDNEIGLVLMLGDGVNRLLKNADKKLRAVPHALQVPAGSESRVWYGLMVLPPTVTSSGSDDLALGCTGGLMTAVSGRKLQTEETDETSVSVVDGNLTSIPEVAETADEFGCVIGGEVYCWHRCMSVEEFVTDVTFDECSTGGKTVACINPRIQMWDGRFHGDYYPSCIAPDTQLETPFPTIPQFPRDEEMCDGFAEFAAQASKYEFEMPLEDKSNNTVGVFQWTVESDEAGTKSLKGRVAFNGIFGFLAFGLAGEGGREGGTYHMLNAPILLALPGSNYTAFAGLDLDMEPTVGEYMTHIDSTSFRHWQTPYEATELRSLQEVIQPSFDVEFDDCYTAMTFEGVTSIAGSDLDLNGANKMIWGANNQDTFVGYHGENRKVFDVQWDGSMAASSAGSLGSLVVATFVAALAMGMQAW